MDDWVRERARELFLRLESGQYRDEGLHAIKTTLHEAIARAREERDSHALAQLRRAHADIERLQAALNQAAEWFEDYAAGHHAKGDTDKANRNATRALHCRAAAERGLKHG